MIVIYEKNGLGFMSVDIENSLFMDPCDIIFGPSAVHSLVVYVVQYWS